MGILDRFRGDDDDDDEGGSSSSSRSSSTSTGATGAPSGQMEYSDFEVLLEACGDIYMFSRALEEKVKAKDSREASMVEDMVEDMSSEMHEFIGTFEVQRIAEKHGVDFNEDIIGKIPEKRL